MKKLDFILSAVIGEAVAWYFLLTFKELGSLAAKFGMGTTLLYIILPISFPILAIIAIWIANLLGKKFLFIFQLIKFFLVGALVTLIDLGLLKVLMSLTDIYAGPWYKALKATSATIAFTIKFLPARIWVFEKTGKEKQAQELVGFLIVSFIGIGINMLAADFIVNVIKPQMGFSIESWGSIGGIGAAFISLIWNFLASKFLVFKK
jgi:putative flippase GtrA